MIGCPKEDLGRVSDAVAVLLTQGTVQRLSTVPPLLAGLSAALQSLLQSGYPLLHFCLGVCGQKVAVAVLHLQLKAIPSHLRALSGGQI